MVNFIKSEFFEDAEGVARESAWIYHLNNESVHNSLEFLNGTYTVVWQRELGVKHAAVSYDQGDKKFIKFEALSHMPPKGGCDPDYCQEPFATGTISFGANTCKFICHPGVYVGQGHLILSSPKRREVISNEPLELALAASLEKGHSIRFGFTCDEHEKRGFKFLEFELARDHPMRRYLIVAIRAPVIPCSDELLYNQSHDAYTKTVFKILTEKPDRRDAEEYGRSYEETCYPTCFYAPKLPPIHWDKDVGIREDGGFDEHMLENNLMESCDVGVKLGRMRDWARSEVEELNRQIGKLDRRKISLEKSLRYIEPRHSAWMKEIETPRGQNQ